MKESLNLKETVCQTVAREVLWTPRDTVVAAVSGGADSMAMLHLLCAMHDEGAVGRIVAAHLNHQLRGTDADADEELVRAFCTAHGIDFVCRRVDVAAVADAHRCGTEEAGRAARYTFLQEIAQKETAVIATAHTLNDQAETVLLRLARGCGLHGAGGMAYRRDNIVRPLLDATRAAVEAYCEVQSIVYATDKTNFEPIYSRNRVRLQAVPALQSVNEAAVANIARFAASCREDDDYLEELAAKALRETDRLTAERVAAWPLPVRKRVLAAVCRECGVPPLSAAHRVALTASVVSGQTVSLPDGWQAVWQGRPKELHIIRDEETAVLEETLIAPPCRVAFGGRTYAASCLSADEFQRIEKVYKNVLYCAIDYDKMEGDLKMRCRREGDRLHPAGRHVGKSLKKWMNETGIPAWIRGRIPVLCDDRGVLAVLGYACDERCAVRPDTRRVILVLPVDEEKII